MLAKQERDHRCDVVMPRIRRRRPVGQTVDEQLRERHGGQRGAEQEGAGQRRCQKGDVEDVGSGEEGGDDRSWIREQRLHHAPRRASDRGEPLVEGALLTAERGNDHLEADERPGQARSGDREPLPAMIACEPVPDAERGERETHELAGRENEDRADEEAPRRSLSRNQIAKRKSGIASVTGWKASSAVHASQGYARYVRASRAATRFRAEMAASEPEDGERTESARHDLNRRQRQRGRRRASREAQAARGSDRRGSPGGSSALRAPSVISSGRPWAVLHTACTMFPRSKRASWKSR